MFFYSDIANHISTLRAKALQHQAAAESEQAKQQIERFVMLPNNTQMLN